MSQPVVQMTADQLQQLIEQVRLAAVAGGAGTTAAALRPKGSFANCTSRFHGVRDYDVVEEFITSIITYKEIEAISDEDALKGLSLLFCDLASTWWQGVRKEAKTWADAIALIREHFSPVKPAYQVYLEIFEKKQENNTPIDTFVCQKRALLAQLPDDRHDEETQLDMVYGLLDIKYRKHILRQEVESFRDLLEKGRIIEYNNMEDEATKGASKGVKRCTYCNFRGHTFDQCRKRKNEIENANK